MERDAGVLPTNIQEGLTVAAMAKRRCKKCLSAMFALGLFASAPLAHAGFGPSTTARNWCKEQTLRYLKKHGYEPYNWVATTYIEGDDYVTKGEWRVDVDDIKVECTSNKHGKKRAGKYKILNIEVLDEEDLDGKPSARH